MKPAWGQHRASWGRCKVSGEQSKEGLSRKSIFGIVEHTEWDEKGWEVEFRSDEIGFRRGAATM